MRLNIDTTAFVQCEPQATQVWIPRGEASFHVTHDPSKSLTVSTPDSKIVDAGTVFTVRVEPDRTTVVVTEGQVQVSAL
jgi:transmembrane sensor